MNQPIARLFVVVLVMFGLLVGFTSRWTVFDATSLRTNPENKRPFLEDLYVPRGSIVADDGTVIADSVRRPSGLYVRTYPLGDLFASPVGYYDPDNGSSELERYRSASLAGSPPQQSSILDQLSGKSTAGDEVVTTLDPRAQRVAYAGLAGRVGAVVALDPTTGAIKVLASTPTYDPNQVSSPSAFAALQRDRAHPLFNNATQSQYAPGSTFKVVTAIAAIDSGRFTPSSIVNGNSPITVATRPLANDGGKSYGPISLTTALTLSVNTVWAQVALKVGASTLQEYMNRLGFYRQPPIDLPSDELAVSGVQIPGHSGYLPLPAGADIGRAGIGEGGLEVTPLQMAMVASAVADHGLLMAPHLTKEIVNPDGQIVQTVAPRLYSRVMSPSTSQQVGAMMTQVVKEGTGTAAALAGITVAGKTGTAQDCSSLAVCDTSQVWFIAYAPVSHPKIAIAVTLEHQVGVGGTIAAPIAKNVLQALLWERRMTLSVAPGTLIDERYRVISRVGSGGMADVYCAEDVQLGRRVAVKMLHERFAADEEFVERFRREASSAAGLSHANIVSVYDRGEWGGTYYIAMEYLDGRSLDSIVREEAPLPPRRAIEITEQVLRAARFAHRRGVVHRDLKPHNVIIDDEGRVKVTDFGIARAGASEITQTGSIMGTARYLSPEQAQGQPVSARSDLYAIGVMLYELLTGAVPFEGESVVAIALRHLSEPPRAPSSLVRSISPSLDAIVLRALAKDPEQRFADADEFLAALEDERIRLDNDPSSQTAALAPIVLPPPPARPIAYPHPATYTTQSLSPASGLHAGTGVAWWDPATGTGHIPPGTVVIPGPGGRQRGPVWPWALLGMIVAAAAAVAIVLLLAKHPAHTAVTGTTVPNVIGESVVVASGNLQQFGYVPKQKLVASQAPQGTVIFQNPGAGSKLAAHSIVRLFVSKGAQPTTLQVPTVVGLAVHAAEHQLHGSRFKTSVVRQASTTVPKNAVISTNPAAGNTVTRGSTVVLTVSSGPPPALVPDVVGQTESQATFLLQQDKFVIGKVTKQRTTQQQPGTVIAQSPRPGKAPQGATVNLTVAQAPPNVTVPYLLGLTRKEAKSRLTALGLTAVVTKVVRQINEQYKGEVISQQPNAGASIAPGTSVAITIEVYQAPVGPTGSSGATGSTGGGGTPPPSGATGAA